jgi:hypothetical protein
MNVILLTAQNPSDWQIYQCKVCSMWMFSHNRHTEETIVVMNNLIRKSRNGLLNLKEPNKDVPRVKMPALKNFNLYELR